MKSLEALKEIEGAVLEYFPSGKPLKIIEQELKALEIIKPYIQLYCVAPNDRGGVRIWFTEDGKHYIDMPQEEYDLLKEVLL